MTDPAHDLVRLSQLIDLIYQGALTPSKWNVIVGDVARYLNAPKGFLFTPMHLPDSGGYLFSHGVPSSFHDQWPHYIEHDLPGRLAEQRGIFKAGGTVVTGEMLMPTDQFRATVFYRDFLSEYDMAFLLGSMIFGTDDADVLPTSYNCYRGLSEGPFSAEECQRMHVVLPHLSRSLGVMQRLRAADMKVAASHAALDLLNHGVVLVSNRRTVVFANRYALRIFEDGDGLRLQRRSGSASGEVMRALDGEVNRAIGNALDEALSPSILTTPHFCRSISVRRPSRRSPYALHFSSLSSTNEFGHGEDAPRAIVFISDAAQALNIDTDWLRMTYGLTAAEARTALLLIEGGTLEDMGLRLGISANTLKTQLRHIYDKTGTHDRARLVRLLLSLSR